MLPKKWRYLEELPQDVMGKIKVRDIQRLFEIPENFNFKILRYHLEENAFTVKCVIPETSDYYNGHFPEFKLLPAVVQIDLVLRFFRGFLKRNSHLDRMLRIKFMHPIFPNVPFLIEEKVSEETGKLAFRMLLEGEKVCASGTLVLKKEL